MPRSRIAMRRVREILRLKWELGLSVRRIARSSGLSHPTVLRYIERAQACGLCWPLPAELDDAELERRLFPCAAAAERAASAARLGGGEPGDEAQGHDAAGAVGRVQGGASERVRIHDLLPSLQELARPPRRGDAPGSSCRRKAVRGLRRANGQRDRPAHRRGSRGPGLRGRAGRLQLHPTRRRPGRSRWRTGSVRMCARSSTSGRCRRSWCRTT